MQNTILQDIYTSQLGGFSVFLGGAGVGGGGWERWEGLPHRSIL